MGCSGSRGDTTDEEYAVLHMEHTLGYHRVKASKLDYNLRKYSLGYSVNENQWGDFESVVGISSKNTDHCPKREQFYGFFKAEDNLYAIKNLLVLGFLLCDGSSSERARLIFESQDMENEQKLSFEDFQSLVEMMIETSVNLLPRLVDTSLKLSANEEQTMDYIRLLDKSKEEGIKKIGSILGQKEIVPGAEIKKEDFISNASKPEVARFLRPHGIRSYIASLTKEKVQQAVKQKQERKEAAEEKKKKEIEERKEAIEERKEEIAERMEEAAEGKPEKQSSSSDNDQDNQLGLVL